MKQIELILIAIILSALTSCSQKAKTPYQEYIKSRVDQNLIPHLPESIPTESFGLLVDNHPESGDIIAVPTRIYLDFKIEDADSILSEVSNRALAKYKYSDSCNLILFRFQDGPLKMSPKGKEWLYAKWIDGLSKCSEAHYPIPNFIDIGLDDNRLVAGLPDDYDLFIIEATSQEQFESKFSMDDMPLPKQWKHGISKGYAISTIRNHLIYWLVVW